MCVEDVSQLLRPRPVRGRPALLVLSVAALLAAVLLLAFVA
jgi:hypothetical protein